MTSSECDNNNRSGDSFNAVKSTEKNLSEKLNGNKMCRKCSVFVERPRKDNYVILIDSDKL